jgi:uncharacterized damage-inducible protein DinB
MTFDPARALRRSFSGRGAHTDVASAVDVPFEIASRRAVANAHNIWQLVWHLNFWMEYELARLDGRPLPYPEHAAVSWPDPETTANAWEQERERFTSMLGRLVEWTQKPDAALQASVPNPPSYGDRRQPSAMEVLYQLAAHNSYHIGQIVVLRQALGAWPPPQGGDTW